MNLRGALVKAAALSSLPLASAKFSPTIFENKDIVGGALGRDIVGGSLGGVAGLGSQTSVSQGPRLGGGSTASAGSPAPGGTFKQRLTSGKTETFRLQPYAQESDLKKRWGDQEFGQTSDRLSQAGFKFKTPKDRLDFLNVVDAESSGRGSNTPVGDKALPGKGSHGPLQIYTKAHDAEVNKMFGLQGGVREMYEKRPDRYWQYGAKLYNEGGIGHWRTSAKKRGVMPSGSVS